MKIYVVETINDYCVQVGFSTSKEKAEKEAEKYSKNCGHKKQFWVTEYSVGKDNFCEFD